MESSKLSSTSGRSSENALILGEDSTATDAKIVSALATGAEKPPVSSKSGSVKKMTKIRRKVLADLTNSDSPIAGLTPTPCSALLCEAGSPVCISSPGTPGTPGIGEDILRSQVNLLLQQVQGEAPPRIPLFGFRNPSEGSFAAAAAQSLLSPGMLVGPTPANTPSMSQPSTALPGSKSRLCKMFPGPPSYQENEVQFDDSRLRRTISDISKITVAETVTSDYMRQEPITMSDRFFTKSLNFDSLLDRLSDAGEDENEERTTP